MIAAGAVLGALRAQWLLLVGIGCLLATVAVVATSLARAVMRWPALVIRNHSLTFQDPWKGAVILVLERDAVAGLRAMDRAGRTWLVNLRDGTKGTFTLPPLAKSDGDRAKVALAAWAATLDGPVTRGPSAA